MINKASKEAREEEAKLMLKLNLFEKFIDYFSSSVGFIFNIQGD